MEKTNKRDIIEKFKRGSTDSGSTEVQVALLTERIRRLTGHMAVNRHDYHTQRSLLKLVGQRKRLLAYLSKQDVVRYQDLINKLSLRK